MTASTSAPAKPRAFREFFAGVGLVGRGFAVWRTAPGLMFLGLIPAFIVAAAFVAGFIALGLSIEGIAGALTGFAAGWDEPFRTGIQVVVGLALLAVAVLIVVYTFTTVTLIVGQPFYERIWRHVEARSGGVPEAAASGFWKTLGRGIGDGLRTLVPTVLFGLVLFALGLIPVLGAALAAILGAFIGGWYLAVELTGLAFEARGLHPRERRRVLKARRPLTLGFGVATYLLFLLPLGAVVAMPAAVAGSALLARRALGEPTASTNAGPSAPHRTAS